MSGAVMLGDTSGAHGSASKGVVLLNGPNRCRSIANRISLVTRSYATGQRLSMGRHHSKPGRYLSSFAFFLRFAPAVAFCWLPSPVF